MSDQGDMELFRVTPHEPVAPELDLETARTILQGIVNFHEQSIAKEHRSDKIGLYSTQQIWEALRLVGEDLMLRHKAKLISPTDPTKFPSLGLDKTAQKDTGHLWIVHRPNPQADSIALALDTTRIPKIGFSKSWTMLYCSIPLAEWDPMIFNYHGFSDYRVEPEKHATRGKLYGKLSLDNYQFMIRGLRWLSANMLNWEGKDFIMPEQLDHPSKLKAILSITPKALGK